jgi:hypothetical protein
MGIPVDINFSNIRAITTAKGPTWVVFGAATWQSFGHSIHLASAHGASDPWLLPVSIDGLMIIAFRYVSHGKTRAARVLAWVVLTLAMLGVVTINYLAAPAGDVIGQALSVAPALGMIAVTVLMHLVPTAKAPQRRRAPRKATNVTPMRKPRAKASTAV